MTALRCSEKVTVLRELASQLLPSPSELLAEALKTAQVIQEADRASTQQQLSSGDRYLQREFEKLKHDALHTTILPPELSLQDMTHEIFYLIRSFSFVGEIGEDPEDYLVGKAKFNDPSAGTPTSSASKDDEQGRDQQLSLITGERSLLQTWSYQKKRLLICEEIF